MCVLHDCFAFIDEARSAGGRVLVHCTQGVSRSATITIAYCMWKLGLSYDEIFDQVKKIRHVVSPNVGFQCVPHLAPTDTLPAAMAALLVCSASMCMEVAYLPEACGQSSVSLRHYRGTMQGGTFHLCETCTCEPAVASGHTCVQV